MTELPPAGLDIIEQVGKAAPNGQLSPEAAEQFVALAARLEAGAAVYTWGLPAFCVFLLSSIFLAFHKVRVACALQLVGFGFLFLIPYVQFTAIAVIGFTFSLVGLLRRR
jgi:hypothetical protein